MFFAYPTTQTQDAGRSILRAGNGSWRFRPATMYGTTDRQQHAQAERDFDALVTRTIAAAMNRQETTGEYTHPDLPGWDKNRHNKPDAGDSPQHAFSDRGGGDALGSR
jgi:hypothetical protein